MKKLIIGAAVAYGFYYYFVKKPAEAKAANVEGNEDILTQPHIATWKKQLQDTEPALAGAPERMIIQVNPGTVEYVKPILEMDGYEVEAEWNNQIQIVAFPRDIPKIQAIDGVHKVDSPHYALPAIM